MIYLATAGLRALFAELASLGVPPPDAAEICAGYVTARMEMAP